jgi:hypothetical protein
MNESNLPVAASAVRTVFEFGRIHSETDWILPLLALAGIVALVIFMYRRDCVELSRSLSLLLVTLRLAAFATLFVIYLQPQWRNQHDVIHNSRALVLVDTSLSMETDDNDASPAEPNRAQKIMAALADGKLLNSLRQVHDVVVLRFDRELNRVVSLERVRREPANRATNTKEPPQTGELSVNWQQVLAPRGTETRLGQALRQLVYEERGAPVAGIIVLTDGQQNAGVEPAVAVSLAAEAGIPIYPVGIGSDRQPANVRISDFQAPARAYPGDSYSVTGFVQAQGLAGKTVTVELLSRPGTTPPGKAAAQARVEGTEQIMLAADGEVTPVRFQLSPEEVGRRTLTLRVKAPAQDRNSDDNVREVAVEVVDRKSRVLLFAGGPSREYQFLRNQLRRDKDTIVDVLLQTAQEGISQDAHAILDEFPKTREELFAYDTIVAFDPDWSRLDAAQIDLVEHWVGDQAGGLIAVAGPIYTDAWAQAPALDKIRKLYPVEFNRRFAVMDDSRYGSKDPWPLEFSREGLEAEFLWLGDSAPVSAANWTEFEGVFGYYAVRGAKPLATVYARYSDPQARIGDQLPVYFASQFYGSGRVFYLGSGEMWRLRELHDSYFETFYTKLIRFVGQGRLLRGSHRGVLLVERDHYMPGDTVNVRAQVTNAQLGPLEVPQLPLTVILPDSSLESVKLRPEPTRPGTYLGQFTVHKEGSYRMELPVPESQDERLVTPPIQVTIPNLERNHVQRNDPLLSEIARQTQGRYYVGLDSALGMTPGTEPLALALRDRSRTLTLAAPPDRLWDNLWMLGLVCGLLCVEWLVRRLVKLA